MGANADNLHLLDEYDIIKDGCDELEYILTHWEKEQHKQKAPRELLSRQLGAMSEYLLILIERIRLYEGLGSYID